MSLQALSAEDRIYFLVTFVEDLVTNSAENQRIRDLIAVEKLKLKHLQDHKPFEALCSVGFLNSSPQDSIAPAPTKVAPPESMPPQLVHEESLKKPLAPAVAFKKEFTTPPNTSPSVFGDPLGKINHLIHDVGIQFIECPGAGKFVLVKVRNKINTTHITLSEDEIAKIIDHFSQRAHIPVIGGILKAAVNDMLISAVSSKYVGSRFLLTKKSPYSLIENFGV